MKTRFRVVVTGIFMTLAVAHQLRGQIVIRNITFERSEIFDAADSTTPGWIGEFFNALHTTTKEGLLRDEILFREGDTLRLPFLAESERKLRRLYFVGDVTVRPFLDGDSCDVVVRTRDRWSLTTNASYKRDGGVEAYGVALSESNFLGRGYGLLGGVEYKTDRSRRWGTDFFFIGKHLPLPGYELTLQYKSSEEFSLLGVAVAHPFFSEESPWSFGLSLDRSITLRQTFQDGNLLQREEAQQTKQLAWAMVSVGEAMKYRLGASYTRQTTEGVSLLPRSNDDLNMLQCSFGLLARSWEKTSALNSLTRVEDVPLGVSLDFIIGRNFKNSGIHALSDYFMVRGVAAASLRGGTYIAPEFSATVSKLPTGSHQTLFSSLLLHHRVSPSTLLIARIIGIKGIGWTAGENMVLGSPNGLRGYDQHAFSGDRSILTNVESRSAIRTPVWIFNFALAGFVDCGTMWKGPAGITSQRFHTSAGLGVRIENMKQQGLGMIRIDIPYSFDRRQISGITISSSHFLSAFSSLENLPPHF